MLNKLINKFIKYCLIVHILIVFYIPPAKGSNTEQAKTGLNNFIKNFKHSILKTDSKNISNFLNQSLIINLCNELNNIHSFSKLGYLKTKVNSSIKDNNLLEVFNLNCSVFKSNQILNKLYKEVIISLSKANINFLKHSFNFNNKNRVEIKFIYTSKLSDISSSILFTADFIDNSWVIVKINNFYSKILTLESDSYFYRKNSSNKSDIYKNHTPFINQSDLTILNRHVYKTSEVKKGEQIIVPGNIEKNIFNKILFDSISQVSNINKKQNFNILNSGSKNKPDELSNYHVILDSGHGGLGTGAYAKEIKLSEDEAAYDVMVRLKLFLEKSKINVYPLIMDLSSKYNPVESLKSDNDEVLLTEPPWKIKNQVVALKKRYQLINKIYNKLTEDGVENSNIALLSIHCDSTWENIAGTTFFITGPEYNQPKALFHSIKLSLVLSESLKSSNLITRSLSPYLLHFVKYPQIQLFSRNPKGKKITLGILRETSPKIVNKILVELVNLQNKEDLNKITDYKFRQSIASALAQGIIQFFTNNQP